uniref:Polyketide synthase n=1 Tax=Nannocystis sp. MB1016 TaxID=1696011 RepID=A0A0M4KMC2_9BACT|nr:polyketide synthase [Nannocystis sp. MB1016]
MEPAAIDPGERFHRYGLDSLRASRLIAALGERLGRALSPTLAWEHPTVDSLLSHVLGERAGAAAAARGPEAPAEPIAIVGMACRIPRAPDVAAFWRLLHDGIDAIGEVPAERGWDALLAGRGVSPAEQSVVRRGAFLARIDGFDPMFFGISPREAAEMDPQQRLMLELAWEALEDGGIAPRSLTGTATGVFAGAIWADYEDLLYRRGAAALGPYTVTGSHYSIIANRISYVLGLQGPSLTIDSACSSGLVVAHLACESLRRGESSVALAGAVNLNVRPESALAVQRFGALSPSGRCRTFDARADGYVRGEGGGMIVLKTLARALADGDRIRAVIRGSAVNNDGASNGLTAPSRAAQEAVLAAAYRRAGVSAGEVQYVEAHGTGTPLGDPIEARALGAVLGAGRPAAAPLLVGSVKTNIGHLEGAAGIAGLIKATLAIERRVVPPNLHFTAENPHAPLAELGLAVPTTARPWPAPERALVAGVSSFGLGGTNAHVVLQEWPGPVAAAPRIDGGSSASRIEVGSSAPRVAFVFPGQGAQWPGMARTLLHEEPVIRASLTACDRLIRQWMDWSLLDELAGATTSRLKQIECSLPAIISLDIAVAAWWRSRGVEPSAVVGHSTGEIAAAHVAGILDLADTMRTICAYGRFVGRFSGRGGMAFVGLPWDECGRVLAELDARVFRAIEDSVEGTVVAGPPEALTELSVALAARGVFARPVRMDVGPHSPLVDSVREELFAALQGIRPRPAQIPLISEVTGAEVDGRTLDAGHWVRNFGDPAFFSRAIDTLIERGHRVFLDVGPHPITAHSLAANLRRAGGGSVIASLRRDEDGRTTLREASSTLAGLGVTVRDAAHDEADEGQAWLLPLSARDAGALAARAGDVAALLREGSRLRDVAFTASVRREALAERLVAVGRSRAALVSELAAFAGGQPGEGSPRGRVRRGGAEPRVMVFAGQGSQWIGMGRQLLAEEPVFRAQVELCDALVREQAGWSLLAELLAPEERSRLFASEVAQPTLFTVQIGLAALLAAWGVRPDAVIGQSAGEVAAAYVAGALTLEDALRVIVLRGQVLQGASGCGKMAWVALPREAAARAIAGRESEVAIAAVNDPGSVLLSGGPALAEVLAELAARGVVHRSMPTVDFASHGPLMEPFAAELVRALETVAARPTTVPIYSTVVGERIAGEELGAAYWGRNVREPVELARAVSRSFADGHRLYVEIGPHPVALQSLSQCLAAEGDGRAIATLRRDGDPRRELLTTLGEVWAHGGEVDLAALHPAGGRVLSLPPYPWQRERHWVEAARPARRSADEHPLLGAPLASALHPEERAWEQGSLAEDHPWVAEHHFGEQAIVPGSAFLALSLAAGAAIHGADGFAVLDLRFERMLALPCGKLQVGVAGDGGLTIASRIDGAAWTRHATARLLASEAVREDRSGGREGARARAGLSDRSGHASYAGSQAVLSDRVSGRASEAGPQAVLLDRATGRAGEAALLDMSSGRAGEAESQDVLSDMAGHADEAEPQAVLSDRTMGHAGESGYQAVLSDMENDDWIAAIRGRCAGAVGAAEHYATLERWGVAYGPRLRSVEQVWFGDGEALGRVRVPEAADEAGQAALLDGALQVAMALVLRGAASPAIPVALARTRLAVPLPAAAWVHARRDGEATELALLDDDGRVLAELSGLRCAAMAGSVDPLAECAYEVTWRRSDRTPVMRESAEGRWIVLGDAGGTGAALARTLRGRGATCVELAPGAVDALPGLLAGGCRGVIHCGSLDAAPWAATTPASLAADLRRGTVAAIATARALLEAGLRDLPRLVLVTRGAQAIHTDAVAAAQAPLWGMARTLVLEHPELECLRVDLPPSPAADEVELLADTLLADDEETEVALRAVHDPRASGVKRPLTRFVARLVKSRIDAPAEVRALSAEATYLLTGGLGGLGLALARGLADRGARHLVLVGRSEPSAAARAAIAAIEATGARVHVMPGDVAEAGEAARIVGQIAATLPPLRGVVHAAAVIGDRTVARLEEAEFWVPIRPKVLGAWHLHAATRELPLEFFVMYSSLVAVLGSLGQAAYGAGNAFLDALAHARAAEGLPATSVQWGTFSDVGMTTALSDRGSRLVSHGLEHFSPAEGNALVERLLARPRVEVALARFSLRRWIDSTPQVAGAPFLSELPLDEAAAGPAAASASMRETLTRTAAGERMAALEDHVVEQLGRVLRLPPEKIERGLPFTRIGLDSLMSLETRNRLERSLGLKLPPTLCFTYPDTTSLAAFLLATLGLASDDGEAATELDDSDDDVLAAFDASLRGLDGEEADG